MQNEIAVFAGGCFWCTEAVYQDLRGVVSITPGYTGGASQNPTYDAVCTGTTGHAEVIKVEFDPAEISYRDLLEVFFGTHNPTTLNQQGNDHGTQYRSAIFFASPEQRAAAEKIIAELTTDDAPIVTTLEPLDVFYPAEDYHHNYYARNQNAGYCTAVISPKLKKFRGAYTRLLKNV